MVCLRSLAARNNAEWCDVVCRTHGLDTRFDVDAWTIRTGTPPLYPDAITLVPEASVPELLARIDASPSCSIKDSFASLDLTAFGFRVLLEAAWIARAATAPHQPTAPSPRWTRVGDRDSFGTWERAWRGDDGPCGVLLVDLLGHGSVAVLAGTLGERVVAGAVLNRSSEIVGISNFFADARVASESWADVFGEPRPAPTPVLGDWWHQHPNPQNTPERQPAGHALQALLGR